MTVIENERFINKEDVSLSKQLKESLLSKIKIRLKVRIKLKLKSWYEQITIKY